MSTSFSVHTMRVSGKSQRRAAGQQAATAKGRTLLLLEAIIPNDFCLEQEPVWLVFGFDRHAGLFRLPLGNLCNGRSARENRRCRSATGMGPATKTHRNEGRGAEAGSSVEPVIAAQFVHLDTLLVGRLTLVRLMRHRLCHHRRPERPSRDGADGADGLARRRRAGWVVEGGEEEMASVDGALSEMVGAGAGALRGLDPSMAPRRWEGAGPQRVARSRGLIEARVVGSAEKNIKVMDRAMGERESARIFQRQEWRGRRELRSGGDGRADAAQS